MELGAGILQILVLLSLCCLNISAAPILNKTMTMSYQLAVELNRSASTLLDLYLSAQGFPFSNDNAKLDVCRVDVKCLPRGPLADMESNDMLRRIHTGVKQFDLHLKNVEDQQKNMNSLKKEMHDELKNTRTQLISLQSNLRLILDIRGHHVPEELECSPEHISIPNNLFKQKQQGCAILREFKRYMKQLLKRFLQLSRNAHGKAAVNS
ncbi:leukemia inhibitory factor-like [Stegostoma tigrinum]|uniref:leukemia inhibitory factor-like n=1 Tax=Stegostoma tigrinum TaxID=3053191 RepID=UPI00202B2207|nr:leukemia inhibitory factor-like [Stegostoma tigrinum]